MRERGLQRGRGECGERGRGIGTKGREARGKGAARGARMRGRRGAGWNR